MVTKNQSSDNPWLVKVQFLPWHKIVRNNRFSYSSDDSSPDKIFINQISYAMLRNSEIHIGHSGLYDGTKMSLTDSDVEDSSDDSSSDKILIS